MQKYYIDVNSRISIVQDNIPEPGAYEVVVKVSYISLCGSDIHLMNGTYNGPVNYPVMFGHEWSGIVEKTGRNVTEFIKGDKVTGDCSRYCGKCEFCAVDKNLCSSIEKYGITIDGASAEYIIRDRKYLYKIPYTVSLDLAALTEPVSVGMNLIKKLVSQKGDISKKKILVLGLGGIGLGVFMLLKYFYKAENVFVSDLSSVKIRIAENLGGKSYLLNSSREAGEDYSSLYLSAEFDIVFETTGTREIFEQSLSLLRPLGTLACLGMIPKVELMQKLIVLKSLTIIGSIGGTGSFTDVINFIDKNSETVRLLISEKYRVNEEGIGRAMKNAHEIPDLVKVQLEF